MATKSFCDRCGKEILGIATVVKVGAKSFDICSTCLTELMNFIEPSTPAPQIV